MISAAGAGTQINGRSVSCGDEHTLVVDVNGKVQACGSNDHGQLGNGTKKSECGLVGVTGLLEKVA